jgi:hypothetical protein
MKIKLLNWGLLLFLCLGTGCTSFHHEWRKASRSPAPTDSYLGRWEGEWLSAKNGHHGKLRCLLGEDSSSTQFRAHFRATYASVLPFSYAAALTGAVTNGVVQFTGESDLGKFGGGVYKYSGSANATHFSCTYESKYDHGTFQMSRSK